MEILRTTPNSSGSYPPIQRWQGDTPPDGYLEVGCDASVFTEFRGFVTPTITNGIATGFIGNQPLLDTYLLQHPDTPVVDPKSEIIAQIQSATTIAALRTAMLEYINAN